jgi:pilus assembly protein CpaB
MIVTSIVLALAAVLLASRWVMQQTTVATTRVVVASKDIDLGTKLSPDMLRLRDWPAGSVPQGSFQDTDVLLKDPKTQDARVLRMTLQQGEPVLESKLAPVGTQGGLSAVISEGKRAITVRVNDVIGVAGFALPGNYVDILVNTVEESSKAQSLEKTVSKIVLERILVLAIAQEVSRDETKPKVVNAVTLEVTPEQAEKIDLARSVGSLSLVLRNQIDTAPALTTGVTKQQLLRGDSAPELEPETPTQVSQAPAPVKKKRIVRRAATPPAASKQTVEIIKGVERSSHEY